MAIFRPRHVFDVIEGNQHHQRLRWSIITLITLIYKVNEELTKSRKVPKTPIFGGPGPARPGDGLEPAVGPPDPGIDFFTLFDKIDVNDNINNINDVNQQQRCETFDNDMDLPSPNKSHDVGSEPVFPGPEVYPSPSRSGRPRP